MAIFLMANYGALAQNDLSEYKYVVVPKRFSDFKEENQHRTNTLVNYLFRNKGFVTAYTDNLPEDLYNHRCLGLYVDLIDNSSMFTTKAALVLKDCDGKEVLMSEQGRSKKKNYEDSYKEAITHAFNSFAGLTYSYKPEQMENDSEPVTISFKNDVKKLDEQSNTIETKDIEQTATEEIQSFKDRAPVDSSYKKGTSKKNTSEIKQNDETIDKVGMEKSKSEEGIERVSSLTGVLYAQELSNGYQLVDSTPKIQLKMYKSSMPNVYVAKGEHNDGVVYSSDGKWFFEYYDEGVMKKKALNIKF